MTTPTLHEPEASDDGAMHPVEQLWTPGEDALENGFLSHRGTYVTGIDHPTDDHLYPVAFLALGHQQWTDIIEAATAYMSHFHDWRTLHLYPGDDPSVHIPHIPYAASTPTESSYGIRTRTTAADANGAPPGAWSGRRPPNLGQPQ